MEQSLGGQLASQGLVLGVVGDPSSDLGKSTESGMQVMQLGWEQAAACNLLVGRPDGSCGKEYEIVAAVLGVEVDEATGVASYG